MRRRDFMQLSAGALVATQFARPSQAAARTLAIALAGNVNTLDPHKTTTFGTDLSVISHLYTPLVDRGPDLALRPGLAKSWQALNDTHWRFELTSGVTFPNGEKLDAAAVKWNVDRVLDPKTGARIKPWFDAITEVAVVSPTTIDFKTKAPYPDLPAQMAMFFLLPPVWSGQNNPSVAASGTGPYDLVEFTSGARVVMKAKGNYWGAPVAFQDLTFRIITDDAARIASLLAGETDLIVNVPPSEMKRIKASGRATASAVDSTRPMMVKFNMRKAPFKDNPALVAALNYAIDKQGIVAGLWDGLGTIGSSQALTPAYFGYNAALGSIPYDPARAKAMLAQAGFASGLKFTLEIPIGRFLQASDIGQVIAAQLADIGVEVKLQETEYGAWLSRLNKGDMADACYVGLAWPTLDAGGLLVHWESDAPLAYYDNAEVTRKLKLARSIVDVQRRQQLYREVTEEMSARPPAIWLFYQPVTYAAAPTVVWQARGDDWVRAMDMRAP